MQIVIKISPDKTITLKVTPFDTIGNIKAEIQKRAMIKVETQQLFFARNELEDTRILSDYNIRNKSILQLSVVMKISVRSRGGYHYIINVEPHDTIENVKRKIQVKEGIPLDQQSLFFSGHELCDNYRLLDYGIENKATIDLAMKLWGF